MPNAHSRGSRRPARALHRQQPDVHERSAGDVRADRRRGRTKGGDGDDARPNFSLEDHLNADIRKTLRKKWDVVVLQQGPSSLDESRRQLIHDVKAIAALTRPPTRIAVLMVWPERSRWQALSRVEESHRLAAAAVKGQVIPAGTAMQAALERDPQLPLFTADGFHPAPMGTYLAALTMYQTLVGPPRSAKIDRILLDAATKATRTAPGA